MQEKDPLESLLHGLPEMRSPQGFGERLYARLQEEPQPALRDGSLRVSGVVCIASALVMFIVLHSPLLNLIPQAFEALRGVLP